MTPAELTEELSANRELAARLAALVAELQSRFENSEPDVHQLAAMALYIGDLYAIVENSLNRILKFFNQPAPTGADWHRALLEAFGPAARPPLPVLIEDELLVRLHELRGFRHVVRVNYSFMLQWARIQPLSRIAAATVFEFLAVAMTRLCLDE